METILDASRLSKYPPTPLAVKVGGVGGCYAVNSFFKIRAKEPMAKKKENPKKADKPQDPAEVTPQQPTEKEPAQIPLPKGDFAKFLKGVVDLGKAKKLSEDDEKHQSENTTLVRVAAATRVYSKALWIMINLLRQAKKIDFESGPFENAAHRNSWFSYYLLPANNDQCMDYTYNEQCHGAHKPEDNERRKKAMEFVPKPNGLNSDAVLPSTLTLSVGAALIEHYSKNKPCIDDSHNDDGGDGTNDNHVRDYIVLTGTVMVAVSTIARCDRFARLEDFDSILLESTYQGILINGTAPGEDDCWEDPLLRTMSFELRLVLFAMNSIMLHYGKPGIGADRLKAKRIGLHLARTSCGNIPIYEGLDHMIDYLTEIAKYIDAALLEMPNIINKHFEDGKLIFRQRKTKANGS